MTVSIEPNRAVVKPRVVSPETGDCVPLEDAVRSWMERHERGVIQITGGPRTGKSTALSDLACVLPPNDRLCYFGPDERDSVESFAATGIAISSANTNSDGSVDPECKPTSVPVCRLVLSLWSEDDWIEYLLARHREKCGSVMQRLRSAEDCSFPRGNPELWTLVLDRMARDDSAVSVKTVLGEEVSKRFGGPKSRRLAARCCLGMCVGDLKSAFQLRRDLLQCGCERSLVRLIWHPAAQLSLASLGFAAMLRQRQDLQYLKRQWPSDLIHLVAESLDRPGTDALQRMARRAKSESSATLVSLLVAHDRRWRPQSRLLSLAGATLNGAVWPHVDLAGCDISRADFGHARLIEANLEAAIALSSRFHGAHLEGANLSSAKAENADFSDARLAGATATNAVFRSAKAERTDFSSGDLSAADFVEANLCEANFSNANLSGSNLFAARITGADFTNADLEGANLAWLRLCETNLQGASLQRAKLVNCDLEFVTLPEADFNTADLSGADLTGSQMPRADFRAAKLCNTGLAEIDWERADLRDADLRGCTFHMGSSRSGLVDSPLASEGTRTGFYTDEYVEQSFKPPEAVRKANLRGADLRGAIVHDVDFYLVDLRDALYTEDQRAHFQRCRAILEDR